MSYRVFARKYRPQTFEEVVGQDHITRTLQNAIRQDRIAQAYLLVGPRGIGKTSTARILAKALNCEKGPTPHPCGQCHSCLEIAEGNDLDVVEIDGASNNGVENIRDIREKAQYSPARGNFKIYLIDEVHMLTIGAFNALLKILEEPPAHVKFLFATTEAHKVPATITSRCQRFDLRRIPDELIAKHLQFIAQKEAIALEPAAAEAIARGADGGLRDAESMFDQVISFCGQSIQAADVLDVFGFTGAEIIRELGSYLLRAEIAPALELVGSQDQQGKDLTRLVEHLVSHLRDVLIVQATHDKESALYEDAGLISREKLLELIEHFATVESHLRWATDKRMQVDVAVIKAAHLIEQASLTEVIDTISSLRDGEESPPLPPVEPRKKSIPSASPTAPSTRTPSAPAPTPAPPSSSRAAPAAGARPASPAPFSSSESSARVPVEAPREESAPSDPEEPAPKSAPISSATLKPNEMAQAAAAVPTADQPLAVIWQRLVHKLAEEQPFYFDWMKDTRFHLESEGRIIILVTEDCRSWLESEIWPEHLKLLDHEISKIVGRPLKFRAEYTQSLPAAPPTPPSPDADEEFPPEETLPCLSPASSGKSAPAVAASSETPAGEQPEADDEGDDEAARKLIEFKNDPLIQQALNIFDREIGEVRRTPTG